MEVYETLPIVPLRDVVVFPHMMMPFVIGRPASTRALDHALARDKRVFLAAQHDAQIDDPTPKDIYTMGCVANVVQSLKLPDGNVQGPRRGHRPRPRHRVEGGQGLLPRRGEDPAEGPGHRGRRRGRDEPASSRCSSST